MNMSSDKYNGFKEMEKEILEGKSDNQFEKVKINLQENKSSFDFIGNLITLYLPDVMSVISKLIGGAKTNK